MRLGIRKAWLWTKLVLLILVLFWIAFFFAYNSKNKADVWLFFGADFRDVPLSLIIPITAVASLVIFFLARKVVGLLQEMNKLREQEQAEQREKRMNDLARDMERKLQSTQAPPKGPDKTDADSGS